MNLSSQTSRRAGSGNRWGGRRAAAAVIVLGIGLLGVMGWWVVLGGAGPQGDGRPALSRVNSPSATQPALEAVDSSHPGASSEAVAAQIKQGMKLLEEEKLAQGRAVLSAVLATGRADLSAADAAKIRERLADVNQVLVFSPHVASGDDLVEVYVFKTDDLLGSVAPQYKIPYELIEWINHVDAKRVRPKQKLKVIKGPFHAVVSKRAFRMDLFVNNPEGKAIYIRSFTVGLGAGDSTPIGFFTIRNKVSNPSWTDPRSGKFYKPNDPENPIGEYWLGLEGADEASKGLEGYGIHGTIEPDSIGKQASLGCVRMGADDIAAVYKILTAHHSTVRIEP